MTLPTRTALLTCLLAAASPAPAAEEAASLGQGRTPCTEFNNLVNGDWSHPLNALNFHGYMAWALGAVSGYNGHSGKPPVKTDTDELKMWLVEYCQANESAAFGAAVDAFLAERAAR